MSEHPVDVGVDVSPLADTSFVPDLDARQRAMLAEMGVRVWAPRRVGPQASAPVVRAPVANAPAPVAVVPRPSRPVAEPVRAPVAVPQPEARPVMVAPAAEGLDWNGLQAAVSACEACGLCHSRKQAVLGAGTQRAHWMVVGETPDEHDDLSGEAFSYQAGQLLDNMLAAVGVSRAGESPERAAYLTQALKCRPPASRSASAEEAAQCEPYLARQVALAQPRIVLAMGRIAAQSLLQSKAPLGRLRGQVHQYRGVPLIATYDLGYLLRTPSAKREAWADLCLALETLRGA